MERREQYDPEDIEQLLLERPYDELLEEERAYVLRHLAGRAEYDAMRALLLTVRHDEGEHAVTDASPEVRERVLDVFRAQQKPQWTIWLNSVKAFLFPKDVSAFWKPALAFASLAAIVSVCVIGFRSLGDKSPEVLADLKQVKEEPAKPASPASPPPDGGLREGEADGDQRMTSTTTDEKNLEAPAFKSTLNEEKPVDQPATAEQRSVADDMPSPPPVNNGLTSSPTETKAPAGVVSGEAEEIRALEAVQATGKAAVTVADSTAPAREGIAPEMTKKDLTANYSITNASTSGFYKAAEAKRKNELDALAEHARDKDGKKDEAVATDARFVDLLRAAW